MNDPYYILGVSRDATDRELRAAYKRRKKQYRSPTLGQRDLRDLTDARKKQIDEAYRQIRRARRSEPALSFAECVLPDPTLGAQVRVLLEEGNFGEADALLRRAPVSARNAEWYFLMGRVQEQRSYFLDALHMMDSALRIDPGNAEYRTARETLKQTLEEQGISCKRSRKGRWSKADWGECCCECVGEIGCECCCEVCDGPC
ncbi:MAG: hypothetical protein IJX28_03110 [Clostridia bacterium]|nr:hypothetical protein [Clostridia bacterium]